MKILKDKTSKNVSTNFYFLMCQQEQNKIFHDVDVGDAKPIKKHPYRPNPVKQQILKEENKYLLENYFIEP